MTQLNIEFSLPFRDRIEAGRLLAVRLRSYASRPNGIVLALPRGGVPIGSEIAMALNLPMCVFAVRKLGVPGREELAMGAITTGGRTLINHAVVDSMHISAQDINLAVEHELRELARRERLYGRGRCMPEFKDKTVILTDDGIATGSTMLLAAQALGAEGSSRIVIAIPVAPAEAITQLQEVAHEVLCLATPEPFYAVGQWYEDFHQITDHEVCITLDRLYERPQLLRSA